MIWVIQKLSACFSTVPSWCFLCDGTVLSRCFFHDGTVSSYNPYQIQKTKCSLILFDTISYYYQFLQQKLYPVVPIAILCKNVFCMSKIQICPNWLFITNHFSTFYSPLYQVYHSIIIVYDCFICLFILQLFTAGGLQAITKVLIAIIVKYLFVGQWEDQ